MADKTRLCPTCHGGGQVWFTCKGCQGEGCWECNNKGGDNGNCRTCHGTGRV